jgi:putative FmdB family regulatory protein
MPRYAYRCPKGHVHEEQRKVDERHKPIACPKCNEPAQLTPSLVAPMFPGADRWR